MARSRVGGTRGLLRGKVGDYIYQITRDATGQFAQNVYGYVRDPLNPSTDLQVCARAAMACVERAMFSFYDFIFNAFQGKQQGIESINEFSKLNYRNIRDEFDGWYMDPDFNEPEYDYPLKGNQMVKTGNFNLAYGTLKLNTSFAIGLYKNQTTLFHMYEWRDRPGMTIGDWLSVHRFKPGDIIDWLIIIYGKKQSDNFVGRFQMCVKPGTNLNTVITSANFKTLVQFKSNVSLNVFYNNEHGTFDIKYQVPDNNTYVSCMGYAIKVSRYDTYQWKFNDCWMYMPNDVYFGRAGFRTPYEVFTKWKKV